jgi:hypothetical protein
MAYVKENKKTELLFRSMFGSFRVVFVPSAARRGARAPARPGARGARRRPETGARRRRTGDRSKTHAIGGFAFFQLQYSFRIL